MKTGHPANRDRPGVLNRREAWFDGQLDLDPQTLVYIDETGASTKMARLYGRAPPGERLRAAIPHGHRKTTTFVGQLRLVIARQTNIANGPQQVINGSPPHAAYSDNQPSELLEHSSEPRLDSGAAADLALIRALMAVVDTESSC